MGTNWEVKAKYNKKHYKRIVTDLDKDLVDEFKLKCKKEGISQSEIIRNAIKKFLKKS